MTRTRPAVIQCLLLSALGLLIVCGIRLYTHPTDTGPERMHLADIWQQQTATMEKVKTFVDVKIAGKRVVVFSKSYCPYCQRAQTLLEAEGLRDGGDMEFIQIENDPNMAKIQDYLQKLTGHRTVPRVFINGKCIGGSGELAKLKASGRLKALL